MPQPLTHNPFEKPLMALNADRKRSNVVKLQPTVIVRRPSSRQLAQEQPDRQHVDVSQPRQAPLPFEEPEPVAAKKKPGQKGYKRSPESIAKMKATLAAKRAAGLLGKKRGKKKRSTRGSMAPVARAPRVSKSPPSGGIADLIATAIGALQEIERRLSQLAL